METSSLKTDRRRWTVIVALLVAVVIAVAAVALASSGAGTGGATSASGSSPAAIVPADALAYVNLSLGSRRPEFRQTLAVLRRLPDFPLLGAAAVSRLGAILAGGRSVDMSTQITPWLGDQAALALLNTSTSTAGSLVLVAVRDHTRAAAFVHRMGAVADGSYHGHELLRYPNGAELTFVGGFLVIGQTASLETAIATAAGGHSLAANPTYTRAAASEPATRELYAYASLAGVRRVLAAQSGVLGALGNLLYQPRLAGVAVAVAPTANGAHVRVHTVLGGAASGAPAQPFTPTLAGVLPAGATLALDVSGLDHVAPQVLNAGSAAGIAGGLGPLISRLGTALVAEGVKVSDLVSIFHGESTIAILGSGRASTLVVVARTSDPGRSQSELARVQAPLERLFRLPSPKDGASPHFVTRTVAGVTDHQIQLTTALQLNYAVFNGLVVISTGQSGIAAVAQRGHRLSADPSFTQVLSSRPAQVTSLVYASLGTLLHLSSAASAGSSTSLITRLAPDLQHIGAAGLSSTRTGNDATTDLTLQIR